MEKNFLSPKYKIVRKLGNGAFGTVYQCVDMETNTLVAIKRIHKAGNVLSREFEILSEIQNSKFCINLLNCFIVKYNSVSHQYLVFNYIDSDLQKMLEMMKTDARTINFKTIKWIGFQIFKGLCELEEHHIMHRDLKPENILKTKKERIKIADFGNSKFYFPKKPNSPYNVTQFYRAPELFLAYCDYDNKIDVWAAGCILAELLFLEPFFKGTNETDQFFAILKVLGCPSDDDVEFYSLNSPLDKKYLNFPNIEPDIKKLNKLYSGFGQVNLAKNFFDRIFQFNPTKRSSASELVKDPFFENERLFFESEQDFE